MVVAVFLSRLDPTLEEIDDVKTAVSEAVDFRSGQPLESESSELAAFLDLSEHCFRFDRSVAPVFQSLFACKKFSCPGFIVVK